jgi:hypothetical protein
MLFVFTAAANSSRRLPIKSVGLERPLSDKALDQFGGMMRPQRLLIQLPSIIDLTNAQSIRKRN